MHLLKKYFPGNGLCFVEIYFRKLFIFCGNMHKNGYVFLICWGVCDNYNYTKKISMAELKKNIRKKNIRK